MCLVKLFLSALILNSVVCFADQEKHHTGFINQAIEVDGKPYQYQIYVPQNYPMDKKWPVMLFLHGAGERGDNALMATEVGLGSAIRRRPEQFPTIAIFPQCPETLWWSTPLCEKIALTALEDTKNKYLINNDKTYLTGVSMGGFGAWELASKHPDMWSALLVIAGRVKPGGGHQPVEGSISYQYKGSDLYKMTAMAVSHIPTWIAHGGKDEIVPVKESRLMYKYLKEIGADVNYHEFSDSWHNVWDDAYADTEAITWLFQQTKHSVMKEY